MVAGRPSFRYQAIISTLTVAMVTALVASLSDFWGMQAPIERVVLFAFLGVAFGWLCWSTPRITLGLIVVAVAAGLIAARVSPGWLSYLKTLTTQAQDLWDHVRNLQWNSTFGPALGNVFLLATSAGAGMLIIVESLSNGRTFWAITSGLLIFGTQWAWAIDVSASYFIAYLVLGYLIWMLAQAAQRDSGWESSGRKVGYRSHIATPLVVILALSIFANILPYDFAPVDLGAVGERLQEAFPFLRELRGGSGGLGGRFSLRFTGFSPTVGSLGGPVQLDRSVALQVKPDRLITSTAYLRGATFLTYTGQTWLPGDPPYTKVAKDGSLQSHYGSDVMVEFSAFTVTPAVSLGNTIFNVLEPMKVEGLSSDYKTDEDGNLWSDRSISRGTAYTVSARLPRYSAEQIRLLSTSTPGDAYTPYLQVPSAMPQRVVQLSRAISSQANHPYDKAVAIESYLRKMSYDLQVPAAPSGRDFVDFFLFELRRGYCTYYATAMTVMLRELGIPARFVEGFAIPSLSPYTEGSDGKRTYTVMNSQAHAWVEAYFPGYGWVTFDPTPRADLPIIDRSLAAPQAGDTSPTDDNGSTNPSTQPNRRLNDNIQDENAAAPDAGGNATAPIARSWRWILGAIALGGIGLLLVYRRITASDRIRATENSQVVQEAWVKTSALLGQFDFGRKPHQTPQEYASSLGQSWPSLREAAGQVAADYTAIRYAPPNRPIEPAAPERAKTLWQQVHEIVFTRYGWRIYFWRRLRRPKDSAE